MFKAWTESALAPGGYSSLSDVRSTARRHSDNMESFVFAETFKCVARALSLRLRQEELTACGVSDTITSYKLNPTSSPWMTTCSRPVRSLYQATYTSADATSL